MHVEWRQRGANPGTVGRSLFGFPGFIRNLARSGQEDLYVLDIVNCHVQILHRRHPGLQHLAQYAGQREEVLASIPVPRAHAKLLFIRLLYGGTVESWRREHNQPLAILPDIVSNFEQDVREAARLDTGASRKDTGRLQYLMNTAAERKAIDAVEELLLSRGATIHALEHDGLCFTLAHADALELAQACSRACSMLVTVEKAKNSEDCLQDII